ncbi:unnamed protein product [Closterium sp. Naga37s-1]|nr:unnamed protein product [Closterium sp. Naga37s-1]
MLSLSVAHDFPSRRSRSHSSRLSCTSRRPHSSLRSRSYRPSRLSSHPSHPSRPTCPSRRFHPSRPSCHSRRFRSSCRPRRSLPFGPSRPFPPLAFLPFFFLPLPYVQPPRLPTRISPLPCAHSPHFPTRSFPPSLRAVPPFPTRGFSLPISQFQPSNPSTYPVSRPSFPSLPSRLSYFHPSLFRLSTHSLALFSYPDCPSVPAVPSSLPSLTHTHRSLTPIAHSHPSLTHTHRSLTPITHSHSSLPSPPFPIFLISSVLFLPNFLLSSSFIRSLLFSPRNLIFKHSPPLPSLFSPLSSHTSSSLPSFLSLNPLLPPLSLLPFLLISSFPPLRLSFPPSLPLSLRPSSLPSLLAPSFPSLSSLLILFPPCPLIPSLPSSGFHTSHPTCAPTTCMCSTTTHLSIHACVVNRTSDDWQPGALEELI